jgi:hypothetical protein
LGNVIAPGAVAAGESVVEGSVSVDEGAGDAIDFWFDGEGDRFEVEAFLEAFKKLGDFSFGEDIVDGKHGEEVGALLEGVERSAADAEGGGIGIVEIGVGFFEVLEFAEEAVVFRVRDFRFRVLIIEQVMASELFAKIGDAVVEEHGGFLQGGRGEREKKRNLCHRETRYGKCQC